MALVVWDDEEAMRSVTLTIDAQGGVVPVKALRAALTIRLPKDRLLLSAVHFP